MHLDLSLARSLPLMLANHARVHFVVVGAGGTGGWIIGAVARLMLAIESTTTKTAECILVDFDVVEPKNIQRQNFQSSEVGLFKASVLAARYSLAWGCKIASVTQPFSKDLVDCSWNKLTVIVGCVDNAAARAEISKCLDRNYSSSPPSIWWLDCGNHASSGQVLLGSTVQFNLERVFDNPKNPNFCINLPSPSVQHPELVVAREEELSSTRLSCAEIQARNRQSLFVNQQVAAIASEYLLSLVLTGGLRRFATYFDSLAGTARSLYNCPQTFKQFVPNQD